MTDSNETPVEVMADVFVHILSQHRHNYIKMNPHDYERLASSGIIEGLVDKRLANPIILRKTIITDETVTLGYVEMETGEIGEWRYLPSEPDVYKNINMPLSFIDLHKEIAMK